MSPTQRVVVASEEKTHPLYSFPTALIVLICNFKAQMEAFELEFNRILRVSHGIFVQEYVILGFLELPDGDNLLPDFLKHWPNHLKDLVIEGLCRDMAYLMKLTDGLKKSQMFGAGCDELLTFSQSHLNDLFDSDPGFKLIADRALKTQPWKPDMAQSTLTLEEMFFVNHK